jgi:hypothetical protein
VSQNVPEFALPQSESPINIEKTRFRWLAHALLSFPSKSETQQGEPIDDDLPAEAGDCFPARAAAPGEGSLARRFQRTRKPAAGEGGCQEKEAVWSREITTIRGSGEMGWDVSVARASARAWRSKTQALAEARAADTYHPISPLPNSFHDDKTSRAVYAAAWVIGIAASLAAIWFVEAMW